MSNLSQKMFIIVGLLTSLGLVMVYSTTGINSGPMPVVKQIFAVAIGVMLAVFFMKIDLQLLRKYSRFILAGVILILVAVLIPGIGGKLNNARRWIIIAGISFQPSELAKIGLLIYICDFLVRKRSLMQDFWKGFVPPVLMTGLAVLLIFAEPDIGTSMLILVVLGIVMIIGGARLLHLFSVGAVVVPPTAFLLAYKFGHVMTRLRIFQNPEAYADGKGYQILQSLIALGSGGWTGVGLGMSRQKLYFLPESHSDFILSIIGEELGIIGTLAVILLFVGLMYYCFRIIRRAASPFEGLLGMGLSLFIGLQALINIAVVTASMPAKGIPLPFVSMGGTSVVFMFISVGLLANIANRAAEKEVKVVIGRDSFSQPALETR